MLYFIYLRLVVTLESHYHVHIFILSNSIMVALRLRVDECQYSTGVMIMEYVIYFPLSWSFY